MSKSYDNTIALFAPREQLRKQIAGIVTDSKAPGEAKSCEGSALFEIFQAFASAEETASMRAAYADGIAWGEAKQMLFERIDREVAPMRDNYAALVDNPSKLEDILQAGALKARALTTPFMATLRHNVGLRNLRSSTVTGNTKAVKTAMPTLKQYREKDGLFYFKLVDARGRLLLQSLSFESPREAAAAIAQLQADSPAALSQLQNKLLPVKGVNTQEIFAALAQLA
jgi:tryptophanyl-tRNA synthetase